jgi:hypothetical protein
MAITSKTSTGELLTDQTIKRRYSQAIKEKHQDSPIKICQGCGIRKAEHNDHTISQKRCKQIHKSELIYDPDNFVDSCPICHNQWESYKSGEYLDHNNAAERMLFMKQHDPEGYNIRINYDYQ